jgi:hypothetical protein
VLALLRDRMRKRRARAGRRSVPVMRRKGEDTFAMKRWRMPYTAKIKREDPFQVADRREIEAMVKRIAAAGEAFPIPGWREEAGFLLFHFPTWAKARAMQHWIDRSGIARRPMPTPFNGPQLVTGRGTTTSPQQGRPRQTSEQSRPYQCACTFLGSSLGRSYLTRASRRLPSLGAL